MTATATAGTTAKSLAYQVLLPGFYGTEIPDWLQKALQEGLFGTVLFGSNTPNAQVASQVISRLRQHNPHVIVAIDEEGGDVTRLQTSIGSSLPGNAILGKVDDTQLTEKVGERLGQFLTAIGIDLNLAPCLDINSDPRNPVIGVRSFGDNPLLVARHGAAIIKGMHRGGVSACGKHFPGHGDVTVDSHLSLPTVEAEFETIEARELVPFKTAFANGLDTLMTAHLVIPVLGEKPATLNQRVIELARQYGFQGPIITDALDMAAVAINPGFAQACVQALNAGADLLCLGTTQNRDDQKLFLQAVDAIEQALASGKLSEQRLRQAAERNQAWATAQAQRRLAHLPTNENQAEAILQAENGLRQVGEQIMSTFLKQSIFADDQIQPGEFCQDRSVTLVDLRTGFNHAAGSQSGSLARALEEEFSSLTVEKVSTDEELFKMTSRLRDDESAPQVVALVRAPDTDLGEWNRLQQLKAACPTLTVVHVGWPVPAGVLSNWPKVLFTYGIGAANARAAANCLRGNKASC